MIPAYKEGAVVVKCWDRGGSAVTFQRNGWWCTTVPTTAPPVLCEGPRSPILG